MLPFSKESAEDYGVRVLGFGMRYLGAPLHMVYLESDLVTGPVTVGFCPCFPIEGVHFILGFYDLARGNAAVPVVTESPDGLTRVFCLCGNPGHVKA